MLFRSIALARLECGALRDAFSGVSALDLLGMADVVGLTTDGVEPWAGVAGGGLVKVDRAPTDEFGDSELEEEP